MNFWSHNKLFCFRCEFFALLWNSQMKSHKFKNEIAMKAKETISEFTTLKEWFSIQKLFSLLFLNKFLPRFLSRVVLDNKMNEWRLLGCSIVVAWWWNRWMIAVEWEIASCEWSWIAFLGNEWKLATEKKSSWWSFKCSNSLNLFNGDFQKWCWGFLA